MRHLFRANDIMKELDILNNDHYSLDDKHCALNKISNEVNLVKDMNVRYDIIDRRILGILNYSIYDSGIYKNRDVNEHIKSRIVQRHIHKGRVVYVLSGRFATVTIRESININREKCPDGTDRLYLSIHSKADTAVCEQHKGIAHEISTGIEYDVVDGDISDLLDYSLVDRYGMCHDVGCASPINIGSSITNARRYANEIHLLNTNEHSTDELDKLIYQHRSDVGLK